MGYFSGEKLVGGACALFGFIVLVARLTCLNNLPE
jgi:hypothetical protein